MKRIITFVLIALLASVSVMAMSRSNIRTNARFLADRMAYELDLTPAQYDDCYEINYDFISAVSYVMDDVVRGYTDAIDSYYNYLNLRNDDLRYVLNTRQYTRFMSLEYFYRPIYSTGRDWAFRIYTIYSNRTFFYYDAPSIFKTYTGGHGRANHANGFYNNRHSGMDHYTGTDHKFTAGTNMQTARRNDFGTNLKDRNNPTQNRQNDYSNKNEKNRTQNQNYRDNSNNQNAPAINQRGSTNGSTMQNTQQKQNGQAQQSTQQSRNGGMQQNQGNNSQNSQRSAQQNNSRTTNNNNGSANRGNAQGGGRR